MLRFYFAVASTCRYVQLIGRVLDKKRKVFWLRIPFVSYENIAGVLTYGSLRKFPPPPPPLPHAVPNDIPEIPFKVSVKGHHFQYKSFICFGSEDVIF